MSNYNPSEYLTYTPHIIRPVSRKLHHLWSRAIRQPSKENKFIYLDKATDMDGFIYLFQIGEYPFYKIGISWIPKQRITEHLGTPPLVKLCGDCEFHIIHLIPTNYMKCAESELHVRYASKNIGLEWFHLSQSDIEDIKAIPGIYYYMGEDAL